MNKLNIYQLIAGALLVLKIGEVGKFADFGWLAVATPLLLGIVHDILLGIIKFMQIPNRFQEEIGKMYLDRIRKRATNKAIREIEKKQEEIWKN